VSALVGDACGHPSRLRRLPTPHPIFLLNYIIIIMAISKQGGAFGYLRKSIGSVTYSAPKLGISQERAQVARAKATEINNPNTVPQILQRMKLGNITRFFSAYENVINKGLMSHSFEKVKYGQPSRLYFNQQALKKEDAVYVPKGVDFFVPGEYMVSEGSLQSLPWRKELDAAPANILVTVGTALTAQNIAALAEYNVLAGMQITIQGAIYRNGRYFAACARVVVGLGNAWTFTSQEFAATLSQIVVGKEGSYFGAIGDLTVAGATVIISEGMDETKDKRSTETMLLVNGYQSLRSHDALQAAIDSYLTGTSVNALNSDWYLNQGNGQSFNGRVMDQWVQCLDEAGVEAIRDAYYIIGEQLNETQSGQLAYTVFTEDGTGEGAVYCLVAEGSRQIHKARREDDSADVKGVELAETMTTGDGYPAPINFVKMTAEIAAQGGFTLGAA